MLWDFCEEYDEENGKCKKCRKYFYLDNNFNCVYINIPFCRKLDENKECKSWAGFYDSDEEDIKKKKKNMKQDVNDGMKKEYVMYVTLDLF